MTYDEYVAAMRNMLVSPQSGVETAFTQIVPRMIEYAELRIYRDLDLLSSVSALTGTLATSSRNVLLPAAIVVLSAMNVITPANVTNPDLGQRVPLDRVSLDYLNAVWGSGSAGTPSCYALLNNTQVRVGPASDAAYTVEFIGMTRPALLSPETPETFISLHLPDLLVSASMVFGAGYRQNFGAASDDPRSAMSWEQVYKDQKAAVNVEEIRRRALSLAGTTIAPQSTLAPLG